MCCTKFHQSSTAFRNIAQVLCCLLLLECVFSSTVHPSSSESSSAEQQRNPLPLSQYQRCVFLASECSERKTLFGCWGRWEAAAAFQSTNVGLPEHTGSAMEQDGAQQWSPQHNTDAWNSGFAHWCLLLPL